MTNNIIVKEMKFSCSCSHCDTYQTCGIPQRFIAGPADFVLKVKEVTSWSKSGFVATLDDGSSVDESEFTRTQFFGYGETEDDALEGVENWIEEFKKFPNNYK